MSIGLLLDMAASTYGGRVALGNAADGISFARLAELASGGGAHLRRLGARQAVLLGRNGPALPHLLFAATHAGIPFCPLNYRLSSRQIQELLADLDHPLVVADDDYLPISVGRVPTISTEEFLIASAGSAAEEPSPVDDRDAAVLLFTSGTTSKAKMVPLRHENLLSYILGTVEFGTATEDEAALVTVPPYHVAAIGSALSNLYAGRRVVYLPDFTAVNWLDLVRREQVTTAMLVPTMLSRIVEYLGGSSAQTPSLRSISYGGARTPVPILEKALAAFDGAGFVNAYGLTETSSTITLLGPEDHRSASGSSDADERSRLGSAGRPVPGIELEVRGPDGTPLSADETGELWVRGPQVSGEYVGVGSVLDAEGWFPTRDRARIDAEGYLFIEGRSDDTIIRGGENIAPSEIEDALLAHPNITEAAVVGVEDNEWGQRLVAVVVARDQGSLDAPAVKEHVRRLLRGSRTPDDVIFRSYLPHTPTGKLLRREVLDDAAAILAASS